MQSATPSSLKTLDAPDNVLQQGYDEQFDPPAPDSYECPICLLVLRKPTQTVCGHRFCRGCILKVLREGRPNCPIDNETLSEKQIYPDNFARREILELKVHCHNYKKFGCQWLNSLKGLPEHMQDCKFTAIPCTNKCGMEVQRNLMDEHNENECPRRIITCKYCDMKVIFQKLSEHNEKCEQYPISCPHNCGMELVREKFNSHAEFECPMLVLKCQFKDCGCTFEGTMNRNNYKNGTRKELNEHMSDISNNHMELLIEVIRKLESKVVELESKIPTTPMEIDNNFAVDKNFAFSTNEIPSEQKTSKEMGGLISQMKDLEMKYTQCKSVMEICRSDIMDLKTDIETKFDKFQFKFSETEKLLHEFTARLWCGVFVWRITEFDMFFRQAKSGDLTALHSQPFYTGVPGYKMCVRVNLNGIDSGANTHISMFVHLMQGEFDTILEWPFPGGLTITIMDQDAGAEAHHVKETLYARPQLQAFARPRVPRNHKGYGYVEMMQHAALRTHGYVKNNTMVVKVEVQMPKK